MAERMSTKIMHMFPQHNELDDEKILCYIDYKAWRFSPVYLAVYLVLVSTLAFITNCIGNVTYPNALFNACPFLFMAGIAFGVIALVLFTLKNPFIFSGSLDIFKDKYSLGLFIQDSSIIALHASLCLSFYARCQVGECTDEAIPFCNPEDTIDAFPFGHGQLILMLPLITHLLVTSKSFGGILLCWAMSFTAMVAAMVTFSLDNGTHYYIGYTVVTLFAIYSVEALSFERYELCLHTGTDVKEDVDLDLVAIKKSPSKDKDGIGKLSRTGSFSLNPGLSFASPSLPSAKPLLGIPYVFVTDLLMPTRFLKDSNKSLSQLLAVLEGLNKNDEEGGTKKGSQGQQNAAAVRRKQISAIVAKMAIILKQSNVCSTLVSMQMNLAGDVVKRDSLDTLRPKANSVNLPAVLVECISVAKAMQKVVTINVISAPKSDMISNILGDGDWIAETMACMICNAIRMSSPQGVVNIYIDIVEDKAGRSRGVSDIELGRTRMLRILVDTDAGQAVRGGMSHPVEIMAPWVEYMQSDASGPSSSMNGGTRDSNRRSPGPDPRRSADRGSGGSGGNNSPGDKKCHNGAAGLCMRGVSYRFNALDGSCDIHLGRIPNPKVGKVPLLRGTSGDLHNSLAVSGGCYFMVTMPYRAGPPLVPSMKREAQNLSQKMNNSPNKQQPQGRRQQQQQQQKGRDDSQSPSRAKDRDQQQRQQQRQQRDGDFSPDRDRDSNSDVPRGKNNKPSGGNPIANTMAAFHVARKFNKHGDYGVADSDSDDSGDSLHIVKEEHASYKGRPVQRFGADHQSSHREQNDNYLQHNNNSRQQQQQQQQQQQHHHHHQQKQEDNFQRTEQRSEHRDFRSVINELNSATWRAKHGNDASPQNAPYRQTFPTKLNENSSNRSSFQQSNAVDEAIEMLLKAKNRMSMNGSGDGSPGGSSGSRSINKGNNGNDSPFAIRYTTKPQKVLLIIPGNIADAQDGASLIISGLKEAGKEVQLESNFVYALNMLLSGASYDAIVMDISSCNSFEATEFVRRLRAWEKTMAKQGSKELHQFVAAITLDDVIISADNELHSGVDTLLTPPIKVTAIMDILNIIKILSVG
jgi:CheY-like chemotaxis protein